MTVTSFITERRPTPTQQVLVGVASTLSWQPLDSDGEPATPAGTVTVGVTTAAGVSVVTPGTATSGTGALPRTYALAARTQLDFLTATWTISGATVATTTIEIVGGFWFSRTDLITRDDNMADGSKYPPSKIIAVRAEVEDEFEDITGTAWVPRFRRVQVTAPKVGSYLVVPDSAVRTVRSVRQYALDGVSYVDFNAADIAAIRIDHDGVLVRANNWWVPGYRYVIEYEFGYDAPPNDLRDAAIARLRHRMNIHRSGIPDRATSMSTQGGDSYSLATPGLRGFITGIPDVDVVLNRYKSRSPGIA